MGNATRVAAVVVENVLLNFSSDRSLILRDCLYVPSIRRNLVSVSNLIKDGYLVYFSDSVVIKQNKCFICSGSLVDNLHVINPIISMIQLNEDLLACWSCCWLMLNSAENKGIGNGWMDPLKRAAETVGVGYGSQIQIPDA